jgi:hypothetical protein
MTAQSIESPMDSACSKRVITSQTRIATITDKTAAYLAGEFCHRWGNSDIAIPNRPRSDHERAWTPENNAAELTTKRHLDAQRSQLSRFRRARLVHFDEEVRAIRHNEDG